MTTVSVRPALRRAMDWHRPLMYFAVLMAVTGVFSLGGMLFDDRILTGVPVWLKPFKFSVSLGIYAVTWAWMMSLQQRPRRWMWWAGTAIAVLLAAGEMITIVTQAARGELSHFNNTSAFESNLFTIMGASIAIVWVLNVVQGVVLLRERLAARPLAWAIRLGVILSLAGMAVAFFMAAGPTPEQQQLLEQGVEPGAIGGHGVGVVDGGPGLPITGWSTTGGDLRVPHFIGIHAMQALPLLAGLLGLAASRWTRLRSEIVRTRLVVAGAIGYGGLLAITTWQAFRGQSLVAPDGPTLIAFGVVVVIATLTALSALSSADREEVTR
ncbi:hypothetical protein EV193_10633 [Herbihabitans rhizosphaerae]|uniref:Uncharacterized protein n=1 Tax=Herbihabitans rhizosphaerae TaxID=1872711 RepID=A0A4Q7KJS1_9PSEU|nr:hypothetical protein [Herbihabitans rhizosphaerae]RZS36799.1 hypothetical protein EV193_10633 [Herbihabitans rhizosphaerae]